MPWRWAAGAGSGATAPVPWVSAILGQAFGGPTWDAVRSEYVVMRKGAAMGVSSQQVTSVAVSEGASDEEYCGWRMHTRDTGMADLAVEGDLEALAALRHFLSYMPSHNGELPPSAPVPAGSDEGAARLLEIVPSDRRKTYDMHRVIEAIFDRDSFLPLKDRHSRVVITGLARPRRRGRGSRCQQSAHQGRRHGRGSLRQGDELRRPLRFLQHPDGDAR